MSNTAVCLPALDCPACGVNLCLVAAVDNEEAKDGSVLVCMDCGEPGILRQSKRGYRLAGMTEEEYCQLPALVLQQIARANRIVEALRCGLFHRRRL